MDTNKTCPKCGNPLTSNAPAGLCPDCLMQAGFPTGTEPDAGAKRFSFRPPSVEELKPHFPQLEILSYIGQGGMGAVYKARQPMLDRYVALKILPPEAATGPGFTERFTREARALARLTHPNIVAVHEFGQSGGYHYLLMEFVDGVNLREMERAQRLSSAQALSIVPKICEALQYAHDEGVVHRDIKPENILVDKKGRVKIADFGIAKILGAEQSHAPLTGVVGTPHYMSPEQIEKPQTVDHRADIYSVGVVFYEMLTGELPLGRFAAPSKKVQIDVRLDEIVLRALEKEPDQRYQNASALQTEVETIAKGSPAPQTLPALTPASPPKFPARMPRLAAHQSCVDSRGIKDCWNWDTRYLVAALVTSIVSATLLSVALLPVMGFRAFLFDLLSFVGIIPVIVFYFVGARVRRLKADLPPDYLEACEAVFVRDLNQRPGLAVLYQGRLELIPITGSKTTIALKDIISISNIRWFNGTLLWAKEGFELNTVPGERLQLAVPKPVAERWAQYFLSTPSAGRQKVTKLFNTTIPMGRFGLWVWASFVTIALLFVLFVPGASSARKYLFAFMIIFLAAIAGQLYYRSVKPSPAVRLSIWFLATILFLDFVLPHSWHFSAGVRFGVTQPWLFLPHDGYGFIFNPISVSFFSGIVGAFTILNLVATCVRSFILRNRRWITSIAVVLVVALAARFAIEPFKVINDAVAPEINPGSAVLVYKLARNFEPGDIVVYRWFATGYRTKYLLGRVVELPQDGQVAIERKNEQPQRIAIGDVIGKVIFNTRGPAAAVPIIENVIVSKDQAVVTQRSFNGEGLLITFGPVTNRWEPKHLVSLFAVSLEPSWGGHDANWVIRRAQGLIGYNLETPNGTITGHIVFRVGTPLPESDRTYVIGDFKPDNGEPIPIAIKLAGQASTVKIQDFAR